VIHLVGSTHLAWKVSQLRGFASSEKRRGHFITVVVVVIIILSPLSVTLSNPNDKIWSTQSSPRPLSSSS